MFGLLALSALLGCPGGDEVECASALVLTDANNYSFTGDLVIPSYPTASGEDVEICWEEMSVDLQCHDMDPMADVDNVGLVRFTHLSQDEVEAGVNSDSLQQADVSGYVEYRTENATTCTSLGEMSFFGTEIDVLSEYNEAGGTYMVTVNSGTIPGVGARALGFLEPTSSSDVTRVDLGDACGMLTFEVDAQSLGAVSVCDEGPWTLDWSGLTIDGQGQEITLEDVDQVMIGYYAELDRASLEDQFLDIELIADDLWQIDHDGGTTTDLSLAVGADGAAFPGFAAVSPDGEGLWILALRCSLCYNPAPLFLTILEPAAAPE